MTKTPLERLKPELGGVGIVLALRHLDELRTDETSKIDCLCH